MNMYAEFTDLLTLARLLSAGHRMTSRTSLRACRPRARMSVDCHPVSYVLPACQWRSKSVSFTTKGPSIVRPQRMSLPMTTVRVEIGFLQVLILPCKCKPHMNPSIPSTAFHMSKYHWQTGNFAVGGKNQELVATMTSHADFDAKHLSFWQWT